jgi:methyl-accepting chemotaxis protein
MKTLIRETLNVIKSLKSTLLFGILAGLPIVLVFLFYTLPFLENYIRTSKSNALLHSIDNAYSVVESYHKAYNEGKLSEEDAKNKALKAVEYMRYGEDGYFFIINRKGEMILHPIKPKLNGTNVLAFKDPNGKELFVDFINIAKEKGEGYSSYMWPKAGHEEPQPKLSYVREFKPWKFIIGTGLYTDDVAKNIADAKSKNIIALIISAIIMLIVVMLSGLSQYNKVLLPVLRIVKKLKTTSGSVADHAGELSMAGNELSESGQSQAANIQETASTMDEITAMVSRNQDAAEKSRFASKKSHDDAVKGKKIMEQIITSIGDIEESYSEISIQVEKCNEEISQITDVISSIGEKTQIINDIVFQTKLLSFNASVEAARAGEHGKGFAVVAEEVGNLAQMSGNAADEISAMLENSTKQVQDIVTRSSESVKQIVDHGKLKLDSGIGLAKDGEVSLQGILENAMTIDDMINEIAEASKEQATGVYEINKAINTLNHLTAENAVLADQTKISAVNLDAGSQELNQIIVNLESTVNYTQD